MMSQSSYQGPQTERASRWLPLYDIVISPKRRRCCRLHYFVMFDQSGSAVKVNVLPTERGITLSSPNRLSKALVARQPVQ